MLGRVIILLAAQHLVIGDLISFDANTYSLYPESHIPGNINGGKLSGSQSLERVSAVRNVMAERGIDAFIVPTSDAHNSQYIAPTDARREWLSGLSGSAGTALVTADHALLWTDGRYFTQFDMQVDPRIWTLMRIGTNVTIESWLASNMTRGSRVGIDPTTYTRSSWTTLENAVRNANISIVPIYDNTVDEARRRVSDPPPARPNEPLLALTVNFTGRASSEKISSLVAQTRAKGASALVLTALDDIAYVLNIRGSDIPYNPVFFSYLVVQVDSANSNVTLFWGDGKLSGDIWQHLQSEGAELDCRPYEEIFDYLASMVRLLPPGSTVWLPTGGSQAIYLALEVNSAVTTVSTTSPVVMMKYLKNDVELGGFRSAHVKDGVAVVRFLRWVHEQVDSGADVTEINVVDKLDELRSEEEFYMGPSFATIAGAGPNGAVIHYKPSRDAEQTVIGRNDMLLVDSGGQYMDGTTDITRTRHMGTPTDIQKQTFTRVLKGQIMLATAVFPRGTLGRDLETFARRYLWDVGLNYAHGTGHGVGHFLNVHEGPVGIMNMASDPGLEPGIIMSNEPGYYEVGEYGIRHEDIVEVINLTKDSDHIYAKNIIGNFAGRSPTAFYTISLAPHQTSCLDVDIMSDDEIRYLNEYHARVLSTLGPILRGRDLHKDYEWLKRECAPIQRSSAVLVKSSPFLLIIITRLWYIP